MNTTVTRKEKTIMVLVGSAVVLAVLIFFSKDFIGGKDPGKVQYVDFNQVQSHEFSVDSQIRALLARNPTNDALTAFSAGDRQFAGVFSVGVETPGVEALEKTNHAFIDSNGVKVISGTTDYSRSSLSTELNLAANKYASGYNICLLDLLLKSNHSTY